MEILFEHSLGWLLPIVLGAFGLAWWVYFFKKPYEDFSRNLRGFLAVLRWMVLTVVAIMLLKPFIVSEEQEIELPKLLLYADVSASTDSAQVAEVITEIRQDALLEEKFDIAVMPFAESVTTEESLPKTQHLHTDFGAVMQSVDDYFYNQNIGAIAVITDGVATKGANPEYMQLKTNAPIYTVGVGDTTIVPDVELSQVLNNNLVFLGNDFEVKARGVAKKYAGENLTISISKDGEVLESKELSVAGNDFGFETSFILNAKTVGVNQYVVSVSSPNGELNRQNNTQSTFIEVLDNRTQIEIIAKVPHPDIAAIKAAIEVNEQYEVQVKLLDEWDGNVERSDLFITHGIPTSAADLSKVLPIKAKNKPLITVLSNQVDLNQFNGLGIGASISSRKNMSEEVGGAINADFSLFTVPENNKLRRNPPMWAPFGDYTANTEQRILLYQSIGQIKTEKPLIAFYNSGAWKTACVFGEGWWKWRMVSEQVDDKKWTDDLLLKAVQYMALKQKRNRLNIDAPNQVSERQSILFKAELYNEAYELVNSEELTLGIENEQGQRFEYTFQNSRNAYQLNIGSLPVGDYTWYAKADVAGEEIVESGTFLVTENKSEFVKTRSDFNFLDNWARKKGGEFFTATQNQNLIQELQELETAKAVIHISKDWKSLIEWEWILFAITILIALEWFLRKFNGYY